MTDVLLVHSLFVVIPITVILHSNHVATTNRQSVTLSWRSFIISLAAPGNAFVFSKLVKYSVMMVVFPLTVMFAMMYIILPRISFPSFTNE